MRRTLSIVLALTSAALFVACGSTQPLVELTDAPTLHAERSEWRGDKSGLVYLRRGVHARVDTAVDPRSATSELVIHQALTRFAGQPAHETLRLLAPPGAHLDGVRARLLDGVSERSVQPSATRLLAEGEGPEAATVDPGQRLWELEFPALSGAQILEVACTLSVPGTLAVDARWLSAREGPTGELLLRYDLPSDAKGALVVVGAHHRALSAEVDGEPVIALRIANLPARAPGREAPYARYVTTRAAPKNYVQPMAATWAQASAPYLRELVEGSEALREGYQAPFVSPLPGREGIDQTFRWVRDRLQTPDALSAPWDAGRPLIAHIEANDLTATDKVHLLHWLLDEAHIDHRLAVARGARYAPISAAFPTPYAFDTALIYIPEHDLWLDPACQRCEPGQVRPALMGGQALVLPVAADATPVELPR